MALTPVSHWTMMSPPLGVIGNPVAVSMYARRLDVELVPVSLYRIIAPTVPDPPLYVTELNVTLAAPAAPAVVVFDERFELVATIDEPDTSDRFWWVERLT